MFGHWGAFIVGSDKKCSFHLAGIGLDVSNFTFGKEFTLDGFIVRWDIVLLVEGFVVVVSVADNLLVLSYVMIKK